MGRKKTNYEQMPGRFPEGTFGRMDAVLVGTETRSDLLRDAVARELRRRERQRKAADAEKAEETASIDGDAQ